MKHQEEIKQSVCLWPSLLGLIISLSIVSPVRAHLGGASVHDVVSQVIQRLRQHYTKDLDNKFDESKLLDHVTQAERKTLSANHIQFAVNTRARLWLVRDASMPKPFWFETSGFKKTVHQFRESRWKLEVWEKIVDPGVVTLGINSIQGGGIHYLVALEPMDPKVPILVSDIWPKYLDVVKAKQSLQPYVDLEYVIKEMPDFLKGKTFVRTAHKQRDDGKMLGVLRYTQHVAQPEPDQIVLTWSDDPTHSQTIQWRSQCSVERCSNTCEDKLFARGYLAYQEKGSDEVSSLAGFNKVPAEPMCLTSPNTINDSVNLRFTATLSELKPDTEYWYAVGNAGNWSDIYSFQTAPDEAKPFSFVYLGDAQNGLDVWGKLMDQSNQHFPQAAFYLMAGDLVDRGNERDDWDDFFYHGRHVFQSKTLVPVIGNHENQGGHPTLYLELFHLLRNGPKQLEPERAYWFEYSNALFVVLDSTLPPRTQTQWLDNVLAASSATWKFVAYHHPAYSSSKRGGKSDLLDTWLPLFDQYQVDFALQGHDHAYLRTYPMLEGKPLKGVEQDEQRGTIYLISVSGTKKYPQEDHDYIEKGMVNLSTYQLFDLEVGRKRLVYRAFDFEGKLVDTVTIHKTSH